MRTDALARFDGLHDLDRLTYQGKKGLATIKAPIFRLLDDLRQLEESASVDRIVELFKKCVLELNSANIPYEGDLIATDECEELCPLLDRIALAVGVDPTSEE